MLPITAVNMMFKKKADGTFEKVEVRKRPGTVGICAAIMNHYQVDAVPHLICGDLAKRETEDALIDLNFIGIDNVLVLRGDAAKNEAVFEPEPGGNQYAMDLLKQVVNLNHGIYLEEDIREWSSRPIFVLVLQAILKNILKHRIWNRSDLSESKSRCRRRIYHHPNVFRQ